MKRKPPKTRTRKKLKKGVVGKKKPPICPRILNQNALNRPGEAKWKASPKVLKKTNIETPFPRVRDSPL